MKVHEVAVGAASGTATLHVPVDDDGWGSLLNDHLGADRELITFDVGVARIDALLCTGDSPTFVKLDVERSEDVALEGMSEVLSASQPVIVFEAATDNAAARRLGRLGYEIMDLLGRPLDEGDHQMVNLLAVAEDSADRWREWPDRTAIEEVTTRYRAHFGYSRYWAALRRGVRSGNLRRF